MVLFLKAWGATAAFFLIVDSIWLGLVAKGFYRDQLGELMRPDINFAVAALFYIFFSAAVVYLVAMPAHRDTSWSAALIGGAVLGLAAYGTYDITNIATIKGWPVFMSIVDMIWGTFVTAFAAFAGYKALVWFS